MIQSRQIHPEPILNALPKRGIRVPQTSHGQLLASKFSVRKTRNSEIIFILGVAVCTCSHILRDSRGFRLIRPYKTGLRGVITSEHRYSFLSEGAFQGSELTMTDTVRFDYYCYRCGENNALDLPAPTAPGYHHTDLKCKSCGDGTRVILSSCPNPDCSHFVYWINDISIPELVQSFAKYMTTNMQAMIDRAAQQGARISIDTPDKFQIPAACPCGSQFNIEISIPDLD